MSQKKCRGHGFGVYIANDDADTLIVNTVVNVLIYHPKVIVVGEDIDLWVLLAALTPNSNNIYSLIPGSGKIENHSYSTECLQTVEGDY